MYQISPKSAFHLLTVFGNIDTYIDYHVSALVAVKHRKSFPAQSQHFAGLGAGLYLDSYRTVQVGTSTAPPNAACGTDSNRL